MLRSVLEVIQLIRQKPLHFLTGFAVAVAGVYFFTALFYETHRTLMIWGSAVWQGVVYLITYHKAHVAAENPS